MSTTTGSRLAMITLRGRYAERWILSLARLGQRKAS